MYTYFPLLLILSVVSGSSFLTSDFTDAYIGIMTGSMLGSSSGPSAMNCEKREKQLHRQWTVKKGKNSYISNALWKRGRTVTSITNKQSFELNHMRTYLSKNHLVSTVWCCCDFEIQLWSLKVIRIYEWVKLHKHSCYAKSNILFVYLSICWLTCIDIYI